MYSVHISIEYLRSPSSLHLVDMGKARTFHKKIEKLIWRCTFLD